MPTDTKVQTPTVTREQIVAQLRHTIQAGHGYPVAQLTVLSLIDAYVAQQLAARTAELEEARKQLAAANAKTLELAQQLHREQGRASRANPFVDRD